LIELLIVVAIIGVLAALLLPALARARDQAKQIACVNNLRQIGIAIASYAGDYDGEIPSGHGALGCYQCGQNVCPDRGTMFMYLKYATMSASQGIGFALLYEGNYTQNARLFFCPGLDQSRYPGYNSSSGWDQFGTGTHGNTVLSSYYYRYADKVPPTTSVLANCACGPFYRYPTKIDQLAKSYPAAAWDSVHPNAGDPCCINTCCGSLNPGYHKTGYNVLYYDGAVLFMPSKKYPAFPFNITAGNTDDWNTGTPGNREFCLYADDFYFGK
jgi:type II secretory pathway pseudopilin PulG